MAPRSKIDNLLSVLCLSIPKRGLDTKKAPPNIGRFPFDGKSSLCLRKFPLTNVIAFGISGRKNKLARYTIIFGNFLPGVCMPFDFPSEFSAKWFAFRKFNNIRIFGNFQKFSEFFVEWKAPIGVCPENSGAML